MVGPQTTKLLYVSTKVAKERRRKTDCPKGRSVVVWVVLLRKSLVAFLIRNLRFEFSDLLAVHLFVLY